MIDLLSVFITLFVLKYTVAMKNKLGCGKNRVGWGDNWDRSVRSHAIEVIYSIAR